jgi:predicted membrane channel-forming protein YqfA (hemolysin III family)
MNWKRFFSANSFIIGTIIIITGFIWMFTLAIVAVPFEQTMIAFFYTISGIIFWTIGVSLNSRASKEAQQKASVSV